MAARFKGVDNGERKRLLPRPLPPYAHLPGKFPHPVRDPDGHSHNLRLTSIDPDALTWGMDLFNHGFYWEAHEAWEPLWRAEPRTHWRQILKGLILLAAAGVKLRERKPDAALRHGRRAIDLFRASVIENGAFERLAGYPLHVLAARVDKDLCLNSLSEREIVFKFIFGTEAERS